MKMNFLEVVKIPFKDIDIFSFEDSKTMLALSYLKIKKRRCLMKQIKYSYLNYNQSANNELLSTIEKVPRR